MIESTQQQRDLLESDAPVKRVIACAGSGKTWVLTKSIADAINKGLCRPEEILALTFTVNAAENMRRRVKSLLGEDGLELDIYTFNSFGNEIIYQNSFELGLGKDFQIIASSQSWQILYEVFKQIEISGIKIGKNTGIFIQDLLSFICDIKNNLISVEGLNKYLADREEILRRYKSRALRKEEEEISLISEELFKIYRRYEEIKSERNMIDYSDQVFLPYGLLTQKKVLREKYSQKYRYILIDEFQDTNVAQARFLTLLYKKGYNRMMIVGDDDQGIYSFRGACVNNILDFETWDCFRDEQVADYYLSMNFRSGPPIIDSTHSIIKQNKKRFDKKVSSSDERKQSKVFFNLDKTLDGEAESIAFYIKNMITNKKIKPGEIAVISRVKRFGKIADALKKENIRYELTGSRNFYHEPEILFLISWLKVIDDIKDEISILYLLKSDKYRIGDSDIFFLKNSGKKESRIDLIDCIRNCNDNDFLSSQAQKRLKSFLASLLLYIRKSGVLDLKELISLIFEDSGLYDELRSGFGRSYKARIRNVENLIKIAADFKKSPGEAGNSSFIMYIRDVARTDYDDPDTMEISDDNTVKLMSIHASKGLEFKAVILPMIWKNDYFGKAGANSRFLIPSDLRMDSPAWKGKKDHGSAEAFKNELKELKIEEERRIFYVACSRAENILLLSHSLYESPEDLKKEEKKPKEIVPFFKDLIIGSRHVIPLSKEAADYLKSIDSDYPTVKKSSPEYFGSAGGNNFKKGAFEMQYKWKKIEKKLGREMRTISSFKTKEGIQKYFKEEYGIDADGILIEKIRKDSEQLKVAFRKSENMFPSRNFFSLTPLLDYLDCPALYKWRYIYSIPQRRDRNMMMGEKIHKYIENLSIIFRETGVINAGEAIGKADEDIKHYIETFLNSRLIALSGTRPEKIYLERLFYLKTESGFITGKLDRIDIFQEGAEIFDYKTGNLNNEELPERYRMQLAAYMAAASQITGIALPAVKGSIFYLGDGKLCTRSGNEDESRKDIMRLSGVVESIKREEFDPVKTKECSIYCHYHNLCKKYTGCS